MKVVIAPDSFKGTLSASNVAYHIADGWRRARPKDDITTTPVADGGEGTVQCLIGTAKSYHLPVASSTTYPGRMLHSGTVSGALPGLRPLAPFVVLPTGTAFTAIIELARAAGLMQVSAHRRDPKRTTTFGFGELIVRAASVPGVRRLVLALGGSATNDGGAGALQALGVRLTNTAGRKLARGGAALADLDRANFSKANRFPDLEIVIACDVDNPLLGERGATNVFAPQKGATPEDLLLLESAMTRYADVLSEATRRDMRNVPGAGAAGGTAAGLLWLFPQATLRPGIEIVLDAVGFDDAVRDADIVITGEGRLDAQTLGGKAVAGVIHRTKAVNPNAKITAIVGSVQGDADELARILGLSALYLLVREGVSVDDAIRNAATHLQAVAERAAKDFAP